MSGEKSFINNVIKRLLKSAGEEDVSPEQDDSEKEKSENTPTYTEKDVAKEKLEELQKDTKDVKTEVKDLSKLIKQIYKDENNPDLNTTIVGNSNTIDDDKIISNVISKSTKMKIFDGLEEIACRIDVFDKYAARDLDKITDILKKYL
jgi:hypothetical protein